jgi:hypothetical protein
MKKREVKEIEKEKEKSRIERENHFKKPKKKSDNRCRWADLGSIQGAAHHQPCTQCKCARGRGRDNFKM